MLVSSGTASPAPHDQRADEATLLEALADAGDALTAALVAHDLAAITSATQAAETACRQLDAGASRPARARRADQALIVALTERIGATARRNALLLESAWTTDAAVLRLLVAAAVEPDEGPQAYQAAAPAQPTGWLDRQA